MPACWSILQNRPEWLSSSWEGEITIENTFGDIVGLSMWSAELAESNGFHLLRLRAINTEPRQAVSHLVLLDPELGVFGFFTPEPAEVELPELGVFSLLALGVLSVL